MSFSYIGKIPSSKSLMNRALILKSFYNDFNVIGESNSDDVKLMEAGLLRTNKSCEIQCGLAGTVFRFLALRCSREVGLHVLIGENRLFERPQDDLLKTLSQLSVDAEIKPLTNNKTALVIDSKGWQLQGNVLNLRVEKSSQFASAVLLSCWDLPKDYYFRLNMKNVNRIPSYSYFEMTKTFLSQMGMEFLGTPQEFCIKANSKPKTMSYKVEPDMSTAMAVAALAAVGGQAHILNFPNESLQPDFIFPHLLEEMGVPLRHVNEDKSFKLIVERAPKKLGALNVNLLNTPDLFPVLSVLCALSKKESQLTGAIHLKHKESNRILKISELLQKMNRKHEVLDDGIRVFEQNNIEKTKFTFDTDHDHRLAMAAGVLRLYGYEIDVINPNVVSKSFPEFWSLIEASK